jgi:alpha-galactosidase
MLSKGTFLDLYVYGFDAPEAYAVEKGGSIYYAFYAPLATQADSKHNSASGGQTWSGEVELRGLTAKNYRVTDYVNQKELGTVTGPTGKMKVEFRDYLLLEVTPAP